VEPTFYDLATGPGMTLLVKTAANPAQFAPSVRAAIHRVDPEIPVLKLQPLEQNVSGSLARRRFALTLLGIFAGIAAFLTAAGIYGLLSYSVNARQREFGIRMAVGASSRELVAMILREAAVLTIPGFVIGLFLLLGFIKAIRSFVYRVSPLDPISVISAAVFLVILTLFAAWLPARRAAAVDPAAALRTE
jgi:ABC-type antimicrobial peptide transport system permease subunit